MDGPRDACTTFGHQVKGKCRIHDHACVMFYGDGAPHHGFPDDDRDYSLDGTETRAKKCRKCKTPLKREDTVCTAVIDGQACGEPVNKATRAVSPTVTCSKCHAIQRVGLEACTVCGNALPTTTRTLIETGSTNAIKIEELRAKRHNRGEGLTDEQMIIAAKATKEQRVGEYLRLMKVAKDKGFKEGFAAHQYRETFGTWPRFSDEDLARGEPSRKPFFPFKRRTA
jgi:hypothetical protein